MSASIRLYDPIIEVDEASIFSPKTPYLLYIAKAVAKATKRAAPKTTKKASKSKAIKKTTKKAATKKTTKKSTTRRTVKKAATKRATPKKH